MTAAEYCDPRLFPLTSQQGLDLEEQIKIDAINYDEYQKAERNYEQLSDHERAVGRELEAKAAARAAVMRERQGRDDDAPQGADGRPLI